VGLAGFPDTDNPISQDLAWGTQNLNPKAIEKFAETNRHLCPHPDQKEAEEGILERFGSSCERCPVVADAHRGKRKITRLAGWAERKIQKIPLPKIEYMVPRMEGKCHKRP
jgi:hypothetical protein